jgi:hypothetical protein
MTHRGLDYDDENPDLMRPLTAEEEKALRSLKTLAMKWPQSLELMSMSGSLSVVFARDPRMSEDDSIVRQESVIATVYGIPNDGGDW